MVNDILTDAINRIILKYSQLEVKTVTTGSNITQYFN